MCATVETDPVHHAGDAADDAAIWLNPSDRSKSTVIGVDKLAGGGLDVYDLSGHELYHYADDRLNNVDIRYGVPLGSTRVTLVGCDEPREPPHRLLEGRRGGRIVDAGRQHADVDARSLTALGFTLYHSRASGAFYAFVTDSGHTDQYLLDGASGQMTGTLVRQLRPARLSPRGSWPTTTTSRLYVSGGGGRRRRSLWRRA